MTYASLLEIAKNKREMSMSIDNKMDRLWTIHTTEHCMARNEISKLQSHNKDNLIYVDGERKKPNEEINTFMTSYMIPLIYVQKQAKTINVVRS